MLNIYPQSAKTIKKVVDILNVLGYFLGTVTGICAGVAVGALVKALAMDAWFQVIFGLLSAFAVAGIIIFCVWMSGLLLWTWSNMADDLRQIRIVTCCDDPEEAVLNQ